MSKFIKDTLPNKPSELLLLALEDMEILEKNPQIEFSMRRWVFASPATNECAVCWAGSVMYNSLGIRGTACPETLNANHSLKNKLYALNDFRTGNITMAMTSLGLSRYLTGALGYYMAEQDELRYLSNEDRTEWKNYMLDLIGILQAEGL